MKHTIYPLSYFALIMILALFAQPVIAMQTYKTPPILINALLKDKADAYQLLSSDVLKQELQTLAKNANLTTADALGDFDKIAIASFLADHQQSVALIEQQKSPLMYFHYLTHAKYWQEKQLDAALEFERFMLEKMTKLSNEELYQVANSLGWSLEMGQDYMLNLFKRYQANNSISKTDIVKLITNYQLYKVYEFVLAIGNNILNAEHDKRYIIEPNIVIKTKSGISLSAVVVRDKHISEKRPAAFQFTIYADEPWHIKEAIHAAAHGYVGVVANTRGKRLSHDDIVPWEHDGEDATQVIDWISKQPWSDGQVAMYGGSYVGFTQWAAAKYMHPALKTMVPYAAANPLTGLPIENNIFLTGNYQWAFHVTNNKTMDHSVYNDGQHWQNTYEELFKSGRAFKDIDKVEGTPNPWFQKWLSHPSFDSYYQQMLPFQTDYEKITIPVLSITGYFDGGQISALDFLHQHYKYNKNANHSLLIGPYNHRTAQGIPWSHHSNYKLDAVALEKDTGEITFQWFDHVLFNKPRPELVKNKVNYQLMGSNTWQHHDSLAQLNQEALSFYLASEKNDKQQLSLSLVQPKTLNFVEQTVDLADRTTTNNESMAWPLIHEKLPTSNGLVFITEPFKNPMQLAGSITGYFSIAINRRDVDIGYNFYEITPDGSAVFLNYYRSRASYADDMSVRKLLTPNEKTLVPIVNARMTAKLLAKGSRLAIVLDVNKNPEAQVNMGTGKDVSIETSADGKEPLMIKWFNDSQVKIPVKPWSVQ